MYVSVFVDAHWSLMLFGDGFLIVPLETFNWLFHENFPLEGSWVYYRLADLRTAQGILSYRTTVSNQSPSFNGMVWHDIRKTQAYICMYKHTHTKENQFLHRETLLIWKVKEEEEEKRGGVMGSKCAVQNLGQCGGSTSPLLSLSVVQCFSGVDKTLFTHHTLLPPQGLRFLHLSVSHMSVSKQSCFSS